MFITSLFLLPLVSFASVVRRIESLRDRMVSVAGSRDNFSEKSPIDPIILNGRFKAWIDSHCTDLETEACIEYFASLRSRERVEELINEIISPVEQQFSKDEIEQSIERLGAEISEVETELDVARSQYESLKVKKYVQKYLSKMLKTMGDCQSPPNSPNIQFVTTHEFRDIKSHFDKYSADLKNANSIREVDLAYEGFRQYLKRITTDGIHPQIAWNACKYFYIQHAYDHTETVSEGDLLAMETKMRELQRKRGELVFDRSTKRRILAEK